MSLDALEVPVGLNASVPYSFSYAINDGGNKNLNGNYSGNNLNFNFIPPEHFYVVVENITFVIRDCELKEDDYGKNGSLSNGIRMRLRTESNQNEIDQTVQNIDELIRLSRYWHYDKNEKFCSVYGVLGVLVIQPKWKLRIQLRDDFSDLDHHYIHLDGKYYYDLVRVPDRKAAWPYDN